MTRAADRMLNKMLAASRREPAASPNPVEAVLGPKPPKSLAPPKPKKNPAAKERKRTEAPYMTLTLGGWTWKVRKFWQADGNKPYGRAFCEVSSPHTFGGADLGDVYVSDLRAALLMNAQVTLDGLMPEQAAKLLGVTEAALAMRLTK